MEAALIGAASALAGVALSQAVSLLQQQLSRRHERAARRTARLEELADQLQRSAQWLEQAVAHWTGHAASPETCCLVNATRSRLRHEFLSRSLKCLSGSGGCIEGKSANQETTAPRKAVSASVARKTMNKNLIAIYVAVLLPAGNAHAFGLGDIVNIGIQAGTKVIESAVDAGIDKVKESMRDPEAEAREKAEKERQIAEAFKKQVDEIEARSDLRPIDRERLILTQEQSLATSAI
ncbi:MAG: hypothetical protein ACP5IY_07175 [Halothiobacillaceae bacterium]